MAGDGSTEALYLFELREVVLHGEHHLVELGRGAAIGQRSADIKRGALRIAIEVAIALAQEEAKIDLSANQEKLSEIDRTLADARAKFNGYLRELGLKEI